MIIQFGILQNSYSATSIIINLPLAYKQHYVGVTDTNGESSNGCVTRFNLRSLSQFQMGWDAFVNVRPTCAKYWITIGF